MGWPVSHMTDAEYEGLARSWFLKQDGTAPVFLGSQGAQGDPDWLAAHAELYNVHLEKSGGYGTGADRLANFTAVSASSGRPAYLYPLDRITEKITRVYSLQAQGRVAELAEELTDIASLALCAEALRRRTDS